MSCGTRKLLVCGSRGITDTNWVKSQIDSYWYWNLACYEDLIMIEGAARGVDLVAKEYAEENNWTQIKEYPAEWDTYGKSAGPIRNEIMVKEADEVLVLWDGSSRGTLNDIHLCEKYNKPFKVIIYNSTTKEDYITKYVHG